MAIRRSHKCSDFRLSPLYWPKAPRQASAPLLSTWWVTINISHCTKNRRTAGWLGNCYLRCKDRYASLTVRLLENLLLLCDRTQRIRPHAHSPATARTKRTCGFPAASYLRDSAASPPTHGRAALAVAVWHPAQGGDLSFDTKTVRRFRALTTFLVGGLRPLRMLLTAVR
jgi:hypothetical protein